MFQTTVECYDCHEFVRDLRAHRRECSNPRRPGNAKHQAHPVTSVTSAAQDLGGKDYFYLLDVSGSMSGQRLETAKEAVMKMHKEKLRDEDRLAIITFDTSAFFKLKPRANGQIKRQAEMAPLLARLFARGGTALYDAMMMALDTIKDKVNRTSEIIVLTDGDDNASKATLAQVLARAADYPKVTLKIVQVDGTASDAYASLAGAYRGTYVVVQETIVVETVLKCV